MRYIKTAMKRNQTHNPGETGGSGQIKRDLVFFWGMHCHGRFDTPTICYALDRGVDVVERELSVLADAGIVDRELRDGVTLYSLTKNEDKRRAIVERVSPGHPGS